MFQWNFVRWGNASIAIYRQLSQVKEIKNETLYNIQKLEFTQLDTFFDDLGLNEMLKFTQTSYQTEQSI